MWQGLPPCVWRLNCIAGHPLDPHSTSQHLLDLIDSLQLPNWEPWRPVRLLWKPKYSMPLADTQFAVSWSWSLKSFSSKSTLAPSCLIHKWSSITLLRIYFTGYYNKRIISIDLMHVMFLISFRLNVIIMTYTSAAIVLLGCMFEIIAWRFNLI